jgi:large subunit ribosomal protein L16
MSFIPRQQKFKKQQKGKAFNKIATVLELNNLKFGSFGLKSLDFGRLSSHQIESMYQAINKVIKKAGRVTMRIFPQTPVSNKPIEVRMGKGKGNIDHWVAKIKAGIILCEIETSSSTLAFKALNLARLRLPIRTKIFYQN